MEQKFLRNRRKAIEKLGLGKVDSRTSGVPDTDGRTEIRSVGRDAEVIAEEKAAMQGPQDSPVRDWIQWKRVYNDKIAHVAGFEEKFVDLILSQIPIICPDDVVPQYQFLDAKGGKRYIDFMIINPLKGYLLPIELDGRYKTNDRHEDWNDFLGRQNALIRSFGTVLRYSNMQMFNSANVIIREITAELLTQEVAKRSRDGREKVLKESATRPEQAPPQVPQSAPSPEPALPKVPPSAEQAPPQASSLPPMIIQPSHSSRPAGQRSIAAGLALFATVVLGYFVFQNGGRQYSAVREAPVASAPIGVTRAPQFAVAVPDVVIQETRATDPPIGVKKLAQTSVAGTAANSLSGNFIPASQAQAYIGQRKLVCGNIARLRDFGRFVHQS